MKWKHDFENNTTDITVSFEDMLAFIYIANLFSKNLDKIKNNEELRQAFKESLFEEFPSIKWTYPTVAIENLISVCNDISKMQLDWLEGHHKYSSE
jgi:hypothetical protein